MGDVDQPDIITAAEDYARHVFEQKIPGDVYTYHNWAHTTQVRDEALLLARQEGVTNGDLEMLNLATLFHDIGFSETYAGHEEVGIRMIKEFLAKWNYPQEKVNTIVGLIETTKMENKPKTNLQAIIKDADTSSLGKSNFQIYTKSLRKELNLLQNALISKEDWNKQNLRFLDEHVYYSEAGKKRYAEMKAENRRVLKEEISESKKDDKGKKRDPMSQTIANSKAAQTQFKTALRNHIDLSAMADNKANIMLSVNALIITFALPLLGKEVANNKALLIPMVMLLIVCVTSMIFATLATRPIPMKGYSSMDSILAKKSNLFF
ncbi:MAG TPA: HD domain-containing protein, partial [Saprospiraceae bacterium]|nr:HD domain-containing protein [Saprospiraceae bacterium]